MSAPAWMPFYVGDYIKDTTHLTTLEHGVYLLLILHYWQHGGLPGDDHELALIAGVRFQKWSKLKPKIERLFLPNWRHKRIDKELDKALKTIGKRRLAGAAGAAARYGNKIIANAIANGMANACTITNGSSSSTYSEVSARARKAAVIKEALEKSTTSAAADGKAGEPLTVTPQVAKSRLAQKSYDRA